MATIEERSKFPKDRISSLPNPLLSRILSLLPTKDAVSTSILSRRWALQWFSITNLDFDNHELKRFTYQNNETLEKKMIEFTNFVNGVLVILKFRSLHTFRLNFSQALSDPSVLETWICIAFRNVRELDLSLELEKPLELPLTKSNFKALAVLKLQGSVHFNIRSSDTICFPSMQFLQLYDVTFTIASYSSVSFPNLKILKLWCVKYGDQDSVHQLFSSCPVLDNLTIYREDWDNVPCLIVRIPSLTRLELHFWRFDDRPFKLQIDTPELQYLHLDDNSKCDYINVNFSSLLEAKVNFDTNIYGTMGPDDNTYSITIFRFIEQLSRVKFLSLSGHSLKAIRTASINSLPGFHNLTRVELEQHKCLDWQVVIETLLPSMDNLEHLVMKGGGMCNGSHESWWIEPLNIPKCLLWRVINISFTDIYNDCRDELELLRYFLNKAKFLQLLKITSCLASKEKLKLVQKISMFPRGSQTCQVDFT